MIWVAVGGRGTLHGAVLGAFLVNCAKTWLTGAMPELWLFVLGGLFIAVTLFLPRGLVGVSPVRRPRAGKLPALGAVRAERTPAHVAEAAAHDRRPASRHILYLDGVIGQLRRLQGAQQPELVVEPGELRAIIGPNGAGKTTMMDVVTGKTRPDPGAVLFNGGIDLTRLDEARDRQSRHRPQVPEARPCSRTTRCSTTSSWRLQADRGVFPTLFVPAGRRRSASASTRCWSRSA